MAKNDPPETAQTLERLKKEGYTEENAKLVIAQCVAAEMVRVISTKMPFDRHRFVQCLEQLPKPPTD